MDLRTHLGILRRRWLILAFVPIVGVATGVGLNQAQVPQYQSTASLYVAAQQANSAIDLSQGGSYTQEVVKSFAAIVDKPIVLNRVIESVGLHETAGQLAGQLTASAPLSTTLLDISAVDSSPARAARIAQAASDALIAVVPQITPSSASKTSSIKISQVQPATVPVSPVSPNLIRNILLGLIAGLALGVGIVYLREALDVRIRSQRDIELITARPILGGITFDASAGTRPLVVHADPRNPRAESFRTLRTNLQFLEFGDEARSMVITSSLESEGKSTTASNLAIAVADAGEQVLLIDADLRRPRIHDYFGIDGSVGLTDVLIGRVTLDEAMQSWGPQHLRILPAGQIPPNPSELLQSHAMVELLATINERFGTVVIDAPPLLPVTDAAILARRTGGAIVVAAANRSNRTALKSALSMLDRVDAHVLGLVVTMLPRKGADAYGYGGYGYGAAYGHGAAAVATS